MKVFRSERALASDLDAALALLRDAKLPEQGVSEHFANFFVVRDAGRVAGVCGLEVHGTYGLLRSLAVDAKYRGEGLGAALVEDALASARGLGVTEVYLLTTTARDYFLGRGFVLCTREQAPPAIQQSWEFRLGCPEGSAFMKRGVPR
ncbi:MAG TPA: arsenic resistance N-acetyltransferase ArsN2 [Vicinamibacteria bacterium]|jgi:N-acetylglutamate synthase-like GNAT family acetyltransferase